MPPRPRWYVVSEAAAIRRVPSHNFDFASLGLVPTGTIEPTNVVLSTGDFNYDFTAAGRLVVGHTLNECLQIEGVYFGVTQSDNTAAVRDGTPNARGGVGNFFSPFGGFGNTPILGVDYNNLAQIQYASSLFGAEVNIRRKVPMSPPGKLTTSILFGVRYTGLPENFDYNSVSDVTRTGAVVTNGVLNSIHVATTNEMVGPQIGALFEFYVDNRWWVNVDMKAAVMNNHAHQTTTYTNVDTRTTTVYTGTRQEDHTAFAEELSVSGVYRWTVHFTAQIGYRAPVDAGPGPGAGQPEHQPRRPDAGAGAVKPQFIDGLSRTVRGRRAGLVALHASPPTAHGVGRGRRRFSGKILPFREDCCRNPPPSPFIPSPRIPRRGMRPLAAAVSPDDQPVVDSRDVGFEPQDVAKHGAVGDSAHDALHHGNVAAEVDVDGRASQHAATTGDPRQPRRQLRRMHVRLSADEGRSAGPSPNRIIPGGPCRCAGRHAGALSGSRHRSVVASHGSKVAGWG